MKQTTIIKKTEVDTIAKQIEFMDPRKRRGIVEGLWNSAKRFDIDFDSTEAKKEFGDILNKYGFANHAIRLNGMRVEKAKEDVITLSYLDIEGKPAWSITIFEHENQIKYIYSVKKESRKEDEMIVENIPEDRLRRVLRNLNELNVSTSDRPTINAVKAFMAKYKPNKYNMVDYIGDHFRKLGL